MRGVSRGDSEAIVQAAHAMKSPLGILAADNALHGAQAVETFARSGDLRVQESVAALAVEIQRLTVALERETREAPTCEF